MLQAIGTGCGCADDRFRKTSLCSALILREMFCSHHIKGFSVQYIDLQRGSGCQ